MRFLILPIVLMSTVFQTDEWSPPKNPDPSAILTEARADARAKEYETALAKHVWYHENALKIQPSQRGVRLSFALARWVELGEKHPPALQKLKEIRDDSTKRVIEEEDIRGLFNDIESINDYLDETQKTVETFKSLDQKQPEKAKTVYAVAQKALVLGKEYKICSKYISFEVTLANIVQRYQRGKKMADDSDSSWKATHRNFVRKQFANQATLIVAILAVNDRAGEAKDFAEAAKSELDDEEFHKALQKSLEGVVPEPWP